MASRTLSVALRALVQGYTGPMRQAAAATGPLEASLLRVQRAGAGMARVGDTLTRRVSLPILGLGAVAVKSAMNFESAFADVTKTVDGTEAQLSRLRQGIIDMAKEVPASREAIAGVAAAAGQLGIQTDNILGFTRVMIDLGNSTNLAAEDAATALARLANITQMPQDQFDRLGSTVVALGNNLATTESEIVNMGLRIAGAGQQIGLTEADILSFAGALSSVGVEAEAGGTAISRVMVDMANSVEQGGDKLEKMAEIAGLSASEFQRAFRDDAAGALATFIEGLGQMADSGQNVFPILDELGFGQIRVRDTLLRAASAGDLFRDSLDLGSQAWEENIALTDEAAQRYKTTESQIKIATNRITGALMDIGVIVAPLLADLAKFAAAVVEAFSVLPKPVQTAVVALLALAAAAGPVMKLGGNLALMFSSVSRALHNIALPAGTVSGAFNNVSVSGTTAAGSMGRLATAARLAAGGAALGAVLLVIDQIGKQRTAERVDELTESFLANKIAAEDMADAFAGNTFAAGDLSSVFDKLVDTNIEAAERFVETAEQAGATADQIDYMRDRIEQKAAADVQSASDAEANAAAVDEQAAAMDGAAESTEEATSALKEYADQLRAMFDPVFGMVDALHDNAEAQGAVVEAQDKLNEAIKEHGKGSAEAKAAQEALTEAHRRASGTALDVVGAMADLNDAIAENPALLEDSKAHLLTWVAQGLISAETAETMAEQFDVTAMKAVALGQTDPTVDVSETGGSRTRGTLDKVRQAAINAGRQKPNVQVRATDRASGVLGFIRSRINELPTSKTITISALYRESGLASSGLGRALARQHGGPVHAGRLYEVAEGRKAELLEMAGRTYLIPGADGQVVPSSHFTEPMSAPSPTVVAGGVGKFDVALHITGHGALAEQVMRSVRSGEIQLRVAGNKVRAGA